MLLPAQKRASRSFCHSSSEAAQALPLPYSKEAARENAPVGVTGNTGVTEENCQKSLEAKLSSLKRDNGRKNGCKRKERVSKGEGTRAQR